MLSREQLQRAAANSGFQVESYEKVHVLVRLLEAIRMHPFLGPRMALKGGTAINLFVLGLPRLSVDIDLNYVGPSDRATMLTERPRIEWRQANDFVEPVRPDAPEPTLRLVYAVRFSYVPKGEESPMLVDLFVDAGDGSIIGGASTA